MISNTVALSVDIFVFVICVLQAFANLLVIVAYLTRKALRGNDNLILLVSLALIDFVYAVLSLPYLAILIAGWVPDGQTFNYNKKLIIGFGGPPAALMKSGCTITALIAIDRIFALYFPMKYYALERRRYLIGGFIFSLLMATFDWLMLFLFSPIVPSPACRSFPCFVSSGFRTYWGLSNTAVNFLSCLLTAGVVFGLRKLRSERNRQGLKNRRQFDDRSANRAIIYILVVSAIFGVIPGIINGCARYFNITILNDIGFFIGVCASISGLSHAFIFGMAHQGIRDRILQIFGRKVPVLTSVSVRKVGPQSIVFTGAIKGEIIFVLLWKRLRKNRKRDINRERDCKSQEVQIVLP